MAMVQIRVDLYPIDQIRRSSLEAKGAIIIVPAPSRELLCNMYYKGHIREYVPSSFRSKRCNYRDIAVKTLDPRQNIMNIRLLSRRRVCRGHNRAAFDKEKGYRWWDSPSCQGVGQPFL